MFDEHEPAEFELTPDLVAIERQLARLTPAAPRIDRDRLMFEAGQASARPERPARLAAKFWPAATAMMTAASVLLATMLVWQRQSTQVVSQPPALPIETLTVDAHPIQSQLAVSETNARTSLLQTTWPAQPSSGYLGVRNVALARGLNAVDVLSSAPRISGGEPAGDLDSSQRKMLNELLPSS